MSKKLLPPLVEVCQQISQDDAAKMLGWSDRTLQTFLNTKQYDLAEEWRWMKGIVYFQGSDRGNLTYNRYVLSMWQIARSQNDVSIYLNAISLFQSVVKQVG